MIFLLTFGLIHNFVGRDECNEDWEFDIDVKAWL